MKVQEFLDKNQLLNCGRLCELLEVAPNTITRMKKQGVTKVQQLALDALHTQQTQANKINLDVTEWFDKTYGNTYFSGYIYFKDVTLFMPSQYGYGSHCETVALEVLRDNGLIPEVKYSSDLRSKYNITISSNVSEVKKRDMYDGTEFETTN